MSKLTSLIRRAPKRISAVALVIAAAIIIPTATLAWGPNRETFTLANPSDHVQFNSITDNPQGDERNFVGVRETGSANKWYDSMNVQSGKTYIVRMYVHNNAATSENLVAKNVTAKVNLPTTTGKSASITGFISASNVGANNKGNSGAYAEVYDSATLTNAENFNLAYVPGTLKYENNAFGPNGTALPESIFSNTGAKLGYDKLDGNIPGCFQYDGYVTFTVKPQFPTPDFTVNKEVRKAGDKTFVESVTANAGDKLNYRITYTNTGGTDQKAVSLKDVMPKGVSYVPNSVIIFNAANPATAKVKDGDKLFTSGINIGDYTAGSNAIVVFDATVDKAETLPLCGPNVLTNKASAQPLGLSVKDDTAKATVNKTCVPNITVCELATKKIVTIKETAFDSKKYSKNLDDCKTPGKIVVCELSTKEIVTILEKDFNATKYSKNLDDCKTVVPPVTPPELPQTGMTENIVAVVGLGALIASIAYYAASRRALNQ